MRADKTLREAAYYQRLVEERDRRERLRRVTSPERQAEMERSIDAMVAQYAPQANWSDEELLEVRQELRRHWIDHQLHGPGYPGYPLPVWQWKSSNRDLWVGKVFQKYPRRSRKVADRDSEQ